MLLTKENHSYLLCSLNQSNAKNIINKTMENEQYFTAAFLDLSQAFDKL